MSHAGIIRFADFSTVGEALDYAARGNAGLSFYSGRGTLLERLPYRRLREQARVLARRLMSADLRKGERLAIIADTSADFIRVFCAAEYAGIVPVPLPLPASFGGRETYVARIRCQIESSGAVGAVSPAELHGLIASAARGRPMKVVGKFEELADVVEKDIALPAIGPDDLCYIQFSSGSTRFPLGIPVTQRALMSNAAGISRWGLQVRQDDRCVSWLPFYHDMGLVGFFLTPLACQLSVDYLATRDFAHRPLLWLTLLSRNGGTISYSPTFGYELCTRRAAAFPPEELHLGRWRVAGIGGDMIRPRVLDGFASVFHNAGFSRNAFVASYGLAEATLAVSVAPLNRGIEIDCVDADQLHSGWAAVPVGAAHERSTSRARDFVICGRPLPGLRVEIRDEFDAALPDRIVGRIFVKGPSVTSGYVNGTDLSGPVAPSGWLDTGDLGYWLDGALVIVGRHKDLIIINGRNISPQDLEWAAEQVPEVRSGDVVAFSIDDAEAANERVVLLVECRSQESKVRAGLTRAIMSTIRAAAAVECDVVLVPPRSLPYTSSGKLSRSQAKRKFLRGEYASFDRKERSTVEPTAAGR